MNTVNGFLVAAAALSGVAAMLHIAIIFFGAPWYRFFGAGERMARLAESGHWQASAITTGIALVLATWALYALSGAGVVRPLPFVKPVLCIITAVYLIRGLAVVALFLFARQRATAFWFWSSAICCVYGTVHLIGLSQVWYRL